MLISQDSKMAAGVLRKCLRPYQTFIGRNGPGIRNCSMDRDHSGEIEGKDEFSPFIGFKCVNEVRLLGYLGSDPKLVDSMKPVIYFDLATNRFFKDNAGTLQKITTWHSVLIRNMFLQDYARRYLSKGTRAYIAGYLIHKPRSWEYEVGNSVQIMAEQVICLKPPNPQKKEDEFLESPTFE